MNYPTNIWLVDESEFDQFVYSTNGASVLYIAEDMSPKMINHPCIVPVNVLNPPVLAVSAEIDGNLEQAEALYAQYLMSEDIEVYTRVILAACIKQTPIGLMFGKDEMNMQSPKMFINFLYKRFGIVVGKVGQLNPYIEIGYMPENLSLLYCTDMIDYPTFIMKHPDLPISQFALPKLVVDVNPAVRDTSFAGYIEYFEGVKTRCHQAGKFLIDPLMGVST